MGLTRQERIRRRKALQILYRLRRNYGVRAIFIKLDPGTFKPEWGKHTAPTRTPYTIQRLVYFDPKMSQRFEYDLGYVAANKNFTYGGTFEVGDRVAIVDRRELPLEIDTNDYFIIDNKRYNVQDFNELDYQTGYILRLRETEGQERWGVFERTIESRVIIDQTVEDVLN